MGVLGMENPPRSLLGDSEPELAAWPAAEDALFMGPQYDLAGDGGGGAMGNSLGIK